MSYTNLPRENGYPKRVLSCYSFQDASHLFTPTADQKHPLAQILDLPDGRRFRYCKEGGNALSAAYCTQSAVGTANWQNQAQTNNPDVPAVGDVEVTITLAATATKDQFEGAWLTIEDGTGEGQAYLIESNKAGTDNATSGYDIVCQLADEGGIRIALAAATELTVTLNKYAEVVVFPTNPTGVATGVPLMAVPANYYFWAQTLGPCPVVVGATDTIVVGDPVGIGTATTAGAACLLDVAADGDVLLGYVMHAASTGETALIDLHLE